MFSMSPGGVYPGSAHSDQGIRYHQELSVIAGKIEVKRVGFYYFTIIDLTLYDIYSNSNDYPFM